MVSPSTEHLFTCTVMWPWSSDPDDLAGGMVFPRYILFHLRMLMCCKFDDLKIHLHWECVHILINCSPVTLNFKSSHCNHKYCDVFPPSHLCRPWVSTMTLSCSQWMHCWCSWQEIRPRPTQPWLCYCPTWRRLCKYTLDLERMCQL